MTTAAPEHANGHARPSSDRVAAWLVLAGAGTTMVSFNLWHAFHAGMPGYLALLDGVAPVVLAMGMSHIVRRRGWFLKIATVAVMLGAMALSVSATGEVVHPAVGHLWWLFGAVVDSAALVALQVILTPVPETVAEPVSESMPESMPESGSGSVPESAGVPPQSPRQVPSRSPAEDRDARAARSAYRKSVAEGQPLSEAGLGAMFGKSRTWGRNRIGEVRAGPATVAS